MQTSFFRRTWRDSGLRACRAIIDPPLRFWKAENFQDPKASHCNINCGRLAAPSEIDVLFNTIHYLIGSANIVPEV
jgi:hypothetical protein